MEATVMRVAALCVAAAMLCAMLRQVRPEIATALSLAAGLAVMAMMAGILPDALRRFNRLWVTVQGGEEILTVLLRAAGISLVAELGAQLCEDAGERALAGRVALAARVAMLTACSPLLLQAAESVAALLS